MSKTSFITRLVFLTSLTLAVQFIGLPQPITGPVINLMLILTTLSLDFRAGIALGCMTPLVAVIRGQLPPILFPMAPFIMVGNALYVTIFYFIYYYHTRKIEYPLKSVRAWIGLILGAFLKFVFLYAAVHFIMPILLGKTFPNVVLAAMSFPQFITAMVGGILAFVIFSLLKKSFFIK